PFGFSVPFGLDQRQRHARSGQRSSATDRSGHDSTALDGSGCRAKCCTVQHFSRKLASQLCRERADGESARQTVARQYGRSSGVKISTPPQLFKKSHQENPPILARPPEIPRTLARWGAPTRRYPGGHALKVGLRIRVLLAFLLPKNEGEARKHDQCACIKI